MNNVKSQTILGVCFSKMSQRLSKFSSFHCLVVILTVATDDLGDILSVLTNFRNDRWENFGLKAGLKYDTTLSNIAADHRSSVEKRLKECLSAWLGMKDNVEKEGVPTWPRLADIMEELGDKAIADSIRSNKCKSINNSIVRAEQKVSTTCVAPSSTNEIKCCY